MDNDTKKLLGITDPNIKFSDHWLLRSHKKGIARLLIMGTLSYKPKACPNCGAVNNHSITKHGFCVVCHPFGLLRRQPLDLKLKTQRFYCHLCHTTFVATSPLFDAHTSITKDLRHEIILRLTRVESIKDIADDLGISASTVQRTVESLADQITSPSRDYLPATLCIDEFKSMRSYYEGRYFKREVTSKTILNLMLEYDDELSATYQYIQELIRCYHQHKVHRFLELLHKKFPGVSHYTNHRCHNLLRRRSGIKRGLTFAFSNGQTEGFNNRIKLIKRVAFGYRNFTTFKTRIYLIINHQITVKEKSHIPTVCNS